MLLFISSSFAIFGNMLFGKEVDFNRSMGESEFKSYLLKNNVHLSNLESIRFSNGTADILHTVLSNDIDQEFASLKDSLESVRNYQDKDPALSYLSGLSNMLVDKNNVRVVGYKYRSLIKEFLVNIHLLSAY